MRIVFIGRDNVFNRRVINELSVEHEITGCFFVELHRGTWKGKFQRIRIKKYPFLKVVDELMFHSFDRMLLRNKEIEYYRKRPEYYFEPIVLNVNVCNTNNIHSTECITEIMKMKPDIIFSVCSSVIFTTELYEIPELGTYVLHEGITPEYRGLHNNLWALMKKDFNNIGYTLLKVTGQIDGGEILVQGKYTLGKDENFRSWSWISHNAIIEGMRDIMEALKQLEKNKTFTPSGGTVRMSKYYTWMGATDFAWLYMKNYVADSYKKRIKGLAVFTKQLF